VNNLFSRPGVAWILYLLWAGAIWVGSSLSLGPESPLHLTFPDKLGHAIEFGLLGALGANALLTRTRLSATKKGRDRAWLGAVTLAALWGIVDEVHQLFVPGRQSDPLDAVADVIGAAVGAWLLIRFLPPQTAVAPEPGTSVLPSVSPGTGIETEPGRPGRESRSEPATTAPQTESEMDI